MSRIKLWTTVMCLLALGASAADGEDSDLKLRVLDETAPAGGLVQMKVRTYEATPISGGRLWFPSAASVFGGVEGIGMFATNGELAGAAVIDGDQMAITYVTTEPLTSDDYPFLTVTLRIRQDVAAGTRTAVTLDPSSLWNVNGTMMPARRVEAGTVTVGGSLAITNVVPGEGWFPAGTVVSVYGMGFNNRSRLKVDDIAIGSVRVVSSTEIQFTLREAANMTAQRLRVDNPDDSRSTYYSYMRGIPAATSGRTLLAAAQPISSGTTRSVSTFGPIAAMTTAQYFALALQNPGLTDVDVRIELKRPDGTVVYSERSLGSGTRLMLELSELVGTVPDPGALVQVTSSLPISVFSLLCDEGTWMVTPRLATEAMLSSATE